MRKHVHWYMPSLQRSSRLGPHMLLHILLHGQDCRLHCFQHEAMKLFACRVKLGLHVLFRQCCLKSTCCICRPPYPEPPSSSAAAESSSDSANTHGLPNVATSTSQRTQDEGMQGTSRGIPRRSASHGDASGYAVSPKSW